MTIRPGPADDVTQLRALLLAGQRFRQAMAGHFELSLSETVVLGHLADAGGQLVPGELSERMLIGSGTLTAVIDRLAGGGYVQRHPHAHDRRRVQVALTPAGRRVTRYVRQHMERALAAANAGAATPLPRLGSLAVALDAETRRILRRRV
ncbi:MAG: MarR family winged helix-turn-helix transcriptional regulator [Jatrophihabitantaceae bacterium]